MNNPFHLALLCTGLFACEATTPCGLIVSGSLDLSGLDSAEHATVTAYEDATGLESCSRLRGASLLIREPGYGGRLTLDGLEVGEQAWCRDDSFAVLVFLRLRREDGKREDALLCTFGELERLSDLGYSERAIQELCPWKALGLWDAVDTARRYGGGCR